MMVEEDESITENQESVNLQPLIRGTDITETRSCTSEDMQKVHF